MSHHSAGSESDPLVGYITSNWDASVRCAVPAPHVVPVPIRHTVPSPFGRFNVLFYWDTYFTNLGLLRTGRLDLARSNCDALLWWIDQLGYVPNSAFRGDATRSQPPVLSLMIREVHRAAPDRAWLASTLPRLRREHAVWDEHRTFPAGLAHYGPQAAAAFLRDFNHRILRRRLPGARALAPEAVLEFAGQLLAEAESGQDFTPLYHHRALDHADVELNCLLWALEDNLARFTGELELTDEARAWAARAELRAARIRTTLWDDTTGLFRPFDQRHRCFASIAHAGTFWPLWFGLATVPQAQAVQRNLTRFEGRWGVAQTEPYPGKQSYQWAFPNGWPPTQWAAAAGLARYGFTADARRLAEHHRAAHRRLFEETGQLWEKIDVTTGRPAGGEYDAEPMLGWSAGVYLALADPTTSRRPGPSSADCSTG